MTLSFPLAAFTMGLVGSTHCVLMCGGIAGAFSAAGPGASTSRAAVLGRALLYNAGRVASYGVAGAVVGGLGSLAGALPFVHDAQVGLRAVAGVLLLGLGLSFCGLFDAFGALERAGAPAWKGIAGLAGRLARSPSPAAPLGLGLLWGLMPCGLVYAALVLAATAGSVASGAAAMVAFGAGTVPMLLVTASFVAAGRGLARSPWVRRGAGVLLCASALVQIQAAHAMAAAPAGATERACCHAHR